MKRQPTKACTLEEPGNLDIIGERPAGALGNLVKGTAGPMGRTTPTMLYFYFSLSPSFRYLSSSFQVSNFRIFVVKS